MSIIENVGTYKYSVKPRLYPRTKEKIMAKTKNIDCAIHSGNTIKKRKTQNIDELVGRRLKLRRNIIGMSQEVLGHKIGVSFQQVQKYERGTNRISASRLFEISNVLAVPVDFFFYDITENKKVKISKKNQKLNNFESLELVKHFYELPDNSRKKFIELLKLMTA